MESQGQLKDRRSSPGVSNYQRQHILSNCSIWVLTSVLVLNTSETRETLYNLRVMQRVEQVRPTGPIYINFPARRLHC